MNNLYMTMALKSFTGRYSCQILYLKTALESWISREKVIIEVFPVWYHPLTSIYVTRITHFPLGAFSVPSPAASMLGRQRQQYNVTVMKHKLQQKELSLNHNLMEDAPESAQETAWAQWFIGRSPLCSVTWSSRWSCMRNNLTGVMNLMS